MFSKLLALVIAAGCTMPAQESADARAWLNQGVQAFKNAQYADAVSAFQRAVQADPSFTAARLYLGTAYMQQFIPGADTPGNTAMAAAAAEEFTQVLGMDPINKVAMASLASLYLNQKKWDEAQQWYEKITALDPSNADAWYSMGFIAWSRWYPAYATARASLGMRPEAPGPIMDAAVRGDLQARYGGVLDQGLNALDKALAIRPDYSDAMAYKNLLLRERADLRNTPAEYQQDTAEADQWVQRALEVKRQQAQNVTGPAAGAAMPQRIRIGGNVQSASLINRVAPVYPPLAAQAGIRGTVSLMIIIGKDGHVADVQVIKAHPLLAPAAVDAVKQWVYKPTFLNGQPVEVQTTVDVELPQQ